jgi:type III pantothenate kinase
MSAQRLLLDAGNTRLKWAVLEAGLWRQQGSAAYSDLSALSQVMEQGASCYIASVARVEHEKQLTALLAPLAITPKWLVAATRFSDVRNTYTNPKELGVDRWMGLIAARERTRTAALVVSVGTAMTVDAMSASGVFMGGVIVPGFAMMQQALQQGTARVAEVAGTWQAFPLNTADAVESGILAALCGAIQLQYMRLAETAGEKPHCILTGGAAEKVLPHLTLPVEYVPTLVLEGIDRVANEDEKA